MKNTWTIGASNLKSAFFTLFCFFFIFPGGAGADPIASVRTIGAWSSKTQLVWDGEAKQLVRRKLRVWDANPAQQLDFYWEPEVGTSWPATEVVDGRGTLSWRKRGTASYDRTAVYSTYKGDLKEGRPHGTGRLETLDGVAYEGQWYLGLMRGEGHLKLENGDDYLGAFKDGAIEGRGVYTSASGEVYDGAFVAGRRHGHGVLTRADGQKVTGEWAQGQFAMAAPGTPQLAQWEPVGGQGNSSGITMAVTTDAKKNAQSKQAGDDHAGVPITYRHKVSGEGIRIEPDDDRLLKFWSDNGTMFDYYGKGSQHYSDNYNIIYDAPAWLSIRISGNGQAASELKSLSIKVGASLPQSRPFLSSSEAYYDSGCGALEMPLTPKFRFINYGWGKAQSSNIEFNFANEKGNKSRVFKKAVEPFDKWLDISIEDAVGELHGDIEALKTADLKCEYDYADDKSAACLQDNSSYVDECFRKLPPVQACREQAKANAPLGGLAPFTEFGGVWDNFFFTYVDGKYNYTWVDSQGKTRPASAKFRVPIVLASMKIKVPAECGDGGPDLPAAGVPVMELSVTKKSYQWAYPIKKPVAIPAGGKSFTVGAFAPQTSSHRFVVVAEFTDGKKVESKPIDFLYFRPRKVELPYEDRTPSSDPTGSIDENQADGPQQAQEPQ